MRTKKQQKRHVNYHTRDLNSFPFFSYEKRRKSHGVPGNEAGMSHQMPMTVMLSEPDEQILAKRSEMTIDTMPQLAVAPKKGHRHANSMLPTSMTLSVKQNGRPFKQVDLGHAAHKSTTNRTKVAYWAGLRVEGGLSPFGINADDLTRWND